MKSHFFYASLAAHIVLSSAISQPQIHSRQEYSDHQSEYDPVANYLFEMRSPDTHAVYYGNGTVDGNGQPYLVNVSAPCDQRDYNILRCVANSTVPELDFAAEQQCLVRGLSLTSQISFWGSEVRY